MRLQRKRALLESLLVLACAVRTAIKKLTALEGFAQSKSLQNLSTSTFNVVRIQSEKDNALYQRPLYRTEAVLDGPQTTPGYMAFFKFPLAGCPPGANS